MMRVLLIKTSSMGDVIHSFPALTDAAKRIPNLKVDWVVEESLAELPVWHPAVDQVIPVAMRRWRRHWTQAFRSGELKQFVQRLRQVPYDYVIDAQGLWKSAVLGLWAQGERIGLDAKSAKEFGLSVLYHRTVTVAKGQHAVERVRQLFAQALNYQLQGLTLDYGIQNVQPLQGADQPYLVFLHSTAWQTKKWPLAYWRDLCQKAAQQGLAVQLPWGNDAEKAHAQRIAEGFDQVEVLDKMSLTAMRDCLQKAHGVVAVDTGLGHLCAALAIPCVSLYGPTNPVLTSAYGHNQAHLHAEFHCAPCLSRRCQYAPDADLPQYGKIWPPCFTTVQPDKVWLQLQDLLRH